MAETYTQKDMKMATDRLAVEAQACGILEKNETLYYTNGSTAVAATLEIRRGVDGDWEYRRANWLPVFSPRDNKRTQCRMMYAAANALRAAHDVISGLKKEKSDLGWEASNLANRS